MYLDRAEVRAICEKDFNFFAALVLGDAFQFDFPQLYVELFNLVKISASKPRDFSKFAFGIPRGFAKTTWAKLVIAWLILNANKKFAGIAAANMTLAEALISDIWEMLTSPNIKQIYGDFEVSAIENSKGRKIFRYENKTIAILGVGAQGSPRGWNIANSRPDILLLDDVQTRECAESDHETQALHRWIFSTFLYTASPFGCTTIFLGNMYPGKNSILKMLEQDSNWTSVVVGAILSNNESLWEELFPIAQLKQAYEQAKSSGTLKYFYAEILNDNEAQQAIDFTVRDFGPVPEDEVFLSSFIVIDPSGRKLRSDKTVIALFGVLDGKPVLRQLILGVFDPKQTITKAVELAVQTSTATICVENVSYQDSLLFWFEELINEFRIEGLNIIPISPNKRAKSVRIREAITLLKTQEILVHPVCQAQVYDEIYNWKPNKANNKDDILDVLAYSRQILVEHGSKFPMLLEHSPESSIPPCTTDSLVLC